MDLLILPDEPVNTCVMQSELDCSLVTLHNTNHHWPFRVLTPRRLSWGLDARARMEEPLLSCCLVTLHNTAPIGLFKLTPSSSPSLEC